MPASQQLSGARADDEGLVAAAAGAVASAADPRAQVEAVLRGLAARPGWDWVGVYLLRGDILELGPFVGAATEHVRIPVGGGVCGSAVAERCDLVVADVSALDNYLACSLGTRSEIVVRVEAGGEVVAVLDADSDSLAAFDDGDAALLRRLAALLAPACRALRDQPTAQPG